MKNYLKNEIKHIPLILILFILFYGITTLATTTLFNSNEVKYNNSTSGIQSDKVQGAIDELYACASNYAAYNTRLTNVENQIYPVGSIYISVNSTNPSTLFGGTWEAFGQGRTLIGVGSNGTDTYAINTSGGAASHTITTNNMPSHTHNYTDYYASSPTGANNGNTGSTTINFSNGYAMLYVASSGSRMYYKELSGVSKWTASYYQDGTANGSSTSSNIGYGTALGGSQAHTHTLNNHTHTVSNTSTTRTSELAGKGNDISPLSTIDPYITVYMWKRTA